MVIMHKGKNKNLDNNSKKKNRSYKNQWKFWN